MQIIHIQNQQVNRRHIKLTYLLRAPEPTRGKKLVSPWPTVLVRTCHCTARPVANFLTVTTGLGFAMRPRLLHDDVQTVRVYQRLM